MALCPAWSVCAPSSPSTSRDVRSSRTRTRDSLAATAVPCGTAALWRSKANLSRAPSFARPACDCSAYPGRAREAGPASVGGSRSPSVAAKHFVAALAQAVREHRLHLARLCIRHWIQVRIELRHQPLTALLDHARRLQPLLVVGEAFLRRQSGHADVI